jgi:hypothetical protein
MHAKARKATLGTGSLVHLTRTTRIALAAVLGLMLIATLSGCMPWPFGRPQAVTLPLSHAPLAAPSSGALIGVYEPPAPYNRTALDSYAAVSAKRPAIVMWYQQWGIHGPYRFDSAMVAAVYARGAVPMISWEPWDPGSNPHDILNPAVSPNWTLQSIASGRQDSYLRSWAQAIRALGGPVMLRPMHEMNGNWYPWCGTVNGNTPQDFVAAWRHMHDVFVAEGATNVTWVWGINCNSIPNTPENSAPRYYPGSAYVDWVALSGFNPGRRRDGSPGPSFSALFATPLSYLRTLGKPIAIAETGCAGTPADKSAWMTDTYANLGAKYPEVKAIVYFDALETGAKSGTHDWRISTSPESERAYTNAISSGYFLGGPMPELSDWQQQFTPAQRAKLAAYPHLY